MNVRFFHFSIVVCTVLFLSVSANAQNQKIDRKTYGKHLVLENIPSSVKFDGDDMAAHMTTANSYSVKGWGDDGRSLIFYKSGNLYTRKGAGYEFKKIMDFDDVSIKSAQKIDVCGVPGYTFLDDEDGDEYSAVYIATPADFKPTKLSEGRANNRAVKVSNSRKMLAYASAKAKSGIWQLYLQESCGGAKAQELYKGRRRFYPKDFHPDDSKILAGSANSKAYKLSEFDVKTSAEKVVFTIQGSVSQARYSSDGQYVFYTTRADAEFIELRRYDRRTGEHINVLANLGVDIDAFVLSDDRSKLLAILNKGGIDTLVVLDADKLKLIAGPSKKSLGVVTSAYFSKDGDKLALSLSQPTVPARSGVYDYHKEKMKLWSGGFAKGQKLPKLIPKMTSYPTFDVGKNGQKRQIPLLVYRPESASKRAPAPVVIFAHGGPASQARPSWSRFYHYIVTKMGIAVLRPNVRGSTGYGRTFERLDQVYKREDSVKDIGALLDWIDTQPDLDSSRIVVAGGSYGGYMSLASLAMYPDRFRAGIARFGVTDFHTFMENTEPYRVDNRRREYGDERDPKVAAFFKEISPRHKADKITKPVLIIQGGQDPRVPQQQAEVMIEAIRANGTEVSYLLADNEGHGFRKSKNRRFSDGAQVAFLRKHLLDK